MRFQTLVAALLIATLTSAQTPTPSPMMPVTTSRPVPPSIPSPHVVEVATIECMNCLRGAIKPFENCNSISYIYYYPEKKPHSVCIRPLICPDACKPTCSAKMIESISDFDRDWDIMDYGRNYDSQSGSPGSWASKARAAIALAAVAAAAAAAAHAFF